MRSSTGTTDDTGAAPSAGDGYRWLLASSTIAFVLAASVATTLHEGAHAAAGLLLGHPVVLGSFSADALTPMGDGESAVMAAAGPVFSLVFGVVVILTGRTVGAGFGRLFVLWIGFIGVQNFVGYLTITPFGAGDSGAVIEDLGLPRAVSFACCAVGVAGILVLARLFLRQECRYIASADELRRLGLFPWLLGTAVTVARTGVEAVVNGAPANTVVVVVAGAASIGIFAPIFSRAWQGVTVEKERLALTRPTVWLVVAVLVVVVQVAVLAPGIRLG